MVVTNVVRIRRRLNYGPMTSGEAAILTGLPLRYCSAVLGQLHKAGKISRSSERVKRSAGPGAYLYSRKSKIVRPWTTAELDKLKSMHRKATADEAAKVLGRPVNAVRKQAAIHRVKLPAVWPKRKS